MTADNCLPFSYSDMPPRVKKMLQAMKLLRECGNYDTSISGAVGEVYAEDVLGMDKGKRGNESVDGWINGRSVQVKTKEIRDDWLSKTLSQRFVQLREGKQDNVDDLIVVMVHIDRVWVHYYGPIRTLEGKKANDVVRYHLNHMNGEGLAHYQKHMAELFPDAKKAPKSRNKTAKPLDGKAIVINRLTIRKAWLDKNVILKINDQRSGNAYQVPHDQLFKIVKRCSPAALVSKSWLEGELYSWPQPSKAMDQALRDEGYKV